MVFMWNLNSMPYNQQYFTINLKLGGVNKVLGGHVRPERTMQRSPKDAWTRFKCWNESFSDANRAISLTLSIKFNFFFLPFFPVLLIKHNNEMLFCWVLRGLWIFWPKKKFESHCRWCLTMMLIYTFLLWTSYITFTFYLYKQEHHTKPHFSFTNMYTS